MIIGAIGMLINSRNTSYKTREIQNFVDFEIGVSLKQKQIVEHLSKNLKMTYRRVKSRLAILDSHHKLMPQSLFIVEFSNILRNEITIVSIDE